MQLSKHLTLNEFIVATPLTWNAYSLDKFDKLVPATIVRKLISSFKLNLHSWCSRLRSKNFQSDG